MTTLNRNDCQGVELKYPLTPKAEKELEAMRPFLSDRLVHDIRCFLGSLRAELQDDEALAMGMMLVAYQLIPRDLSIVKNTMLGFFARIKEQVLDNFVERRG
ncbi:MAG: hypothetical protein ACI3Y0_04180 [Prevotella sp.]